MASKRIEKPMGSTWTDEQWLAIAERDSHLLVAAAAGSGKTAVLVERIIRRISEGPEPIDVDRLLVATFTKAAADEMRGRIREALERRLEEQPGHEHLRRQLAFIHRASITTLHSFCMEVIQRHYQLAGLNPNFRIGNETETELIRREVMEALFETQYAECEPECEFWRLVDAYSGERSDEPLYRLVEQLYEYSRSHPWPESWLRSMADAFDGDGHVWQRSLQQDVRLELASVQQLLLEAGKLAQTPGGPEPYAETLQAEAAMVGAAMETAASGSWDALHEQMQLVSFGKLKPCKGADKQLQEQAKSLRDQAKKSLAALAVECFGRTPEEHREDCRRTAPLMQELVRLVVKFAADYEQAKQEKGLVDFSDLEHYCLRVLRAPVSTPERDVPSEAALVYRAHFEEVLLDEYQDTNQVQEAIVAMISREAPHGNRFMVGDVKQSIYRFRLADPGLFMHKYRAYPLVIDAEEAAMEGRRIDLARNFRSRRQVLEGVNFLFRQLMSEAVGEMTYDDAASLIPGASFPDPISLGPNDLAIDVLLLSKAGMPEEAAETADSGEAGEETGASDFADETPEEDASTAQLEARMIAMQIKRLLGEGGAPPFLVTDKKTGGTRAVTYRDIVILLRATRDWSPVLIEELRLAGIPAYAELSTGYFSAGEVEIMMSLLKIIDNPYQDIPLAAVLRSAIVKLSVEEMAAIRVAGMNLPYYEAVRHYVQMEQPEPVLKEKLERFLELHALWRREARQSPVSDLLWRIYRVTGFYDSAGAMPGGVQRQANLRALYDRARQFESTSFRGLFRFLRFIERMREQGGDLGAAGAIGEQEDVVRILSIHKSKGLEFPVVFVAGMGKAFNMMDLNGSFLMHKELGFGPKRVDTDLRVSYPTMAHLAIRKRLRLETLAEELRVLYVALTRPKEKLFLLGTVRDAAKSAAKWSMAAEHRELALPDGMLAGARCYLDWLGPALMRHKDAFALRELAGLPDIVPPPVLNGEPSRWNVFCGGTEGLALAAAAREARDETVMQAIYKGEPVYHLHSSLTDEVEARLVWRYPYDQATGFFSKTSVSEMKRRITAEERRAEWEDAAAIGGEGAEAGAKPRYKKSLLRRPRFMEERQLTPAERGTLYHTVMQHLPLHLEPSADRVRAWLESEVLHKRLPAHAASAIEADSIAKYLASPLADRMRRSADVRRELPFSYGIPAERVYAASAPEVAGETILMQGVMDGLFAEDGGWVLIDYKTDKLWQDNAIEEVAARYELQIRLYSEAISQILGQPVKEAYLYLFDGAHTIRML